MSLINPNISITKFNTTNWLLNSGEKNILINSSTLGLIKILQEADNYEEAKESFQSWQGVIFEKDEFLGFVENCFKGKGILVGDKTVNEPHSYVTAKVEILSAKTASILATPFKPLYSASIFFITISILIVFIGTFFIKHSHFLNLNVSIQANRLIHIAVFLGLSTLIHELGHIAALNKNGIKDNGCIGIGFYSISPVVYSDVSMAWRLSRYKRIIVNLGGIVAEISLAMLLYGIYTVSHKDYLLTCSYIIIVHALFQLNPFMRSDGYWILSDGLNIPNLLPKSKNLIRAVFSFKNRLFTEGEGKTSFILCYGVINYLILLGFIYYSVSNHIQGIIRFPIEVLTMLYNIFKLDFDAVKVKNIWVLYISFYVMVYNYGLLIAIFIRNKALKLSVLK
jgi:putative peptide zinc metalloprotease protein